MLLRNRSRWRHASIANGHRCNLDYHKRTDHRAGEFSAMDSNCTSLEIERLDGARWSIRPMEHADMDKCLFIWSQVELTEAKQTLASVLTDDPDGFYVAELVDTGEVIGMCAGPITRPDTAFMGFYAVDPQFQRMGIGKELWSKTMERLSSLNVGLYGVPSMSAKYKKSGFMVEDSTRMLVFESEAYADDKLKLEKLKQVNELEGCRLIRIDGNSSERTFQKLVHYDETVQKFNRDKLLRVYLTDQAPPLTVALIGATTAVAASQQQQQQSNYGPGIAQEQRKSSCCIKSSRPEATIDEDQEAEVSSMRSNLASVSSNSLGDLRGSKEMADSTIADGTAASPAEMGQNDEILGYGIIRLDNNGGGIIGPIYADSNEACEVLLHYLISNFDLERGHILSAMALTSNKQACQILAKVGLSEIEQCSRMFTKFVPEANFSKVYYVHSPNFTLF